MVSANISTYSPRKDFLPQVVKSLKKQTVKPDVIRIWYNDYEPVNTKGIEQHFNGENHTDKSKFIWLDNIRVTGKHEIYFTMDDDIKYPPDYVESMIQALKRYPGHVVSYHGRKLRGKHRNYYFEHTQYNFLTNLEQDAPVEVPGTGVTAFDTRTFIPDIIQYNDDCMADVLMGLEMAKNKVPGICLAHKGGWIEGLPVSETIYKNHSRSCHRQTELASQIWDICYNDE